MAKYKDRVAGGKVPYLPKYSHNYHIDASMETKMDNIADLAVLGIKLVNPTIGEKLDDIKDTFDMIMPKNPINKSIGEQKADLKAFDRIVFNSIVPTKSKLNSALNNANKPSNQPTVSSNQPNNNFMNQTLSNVNNIPTPKPMPIGSGQSNTKTDSGVFSTTPNGPVNTSTTTLNSNSTISSFQNRGLNNIIGILSNPPLIDIKPKNR